MSHPADLIARIRLQLEQDYNPAQYRYVIEQAIPKTRMFPDILIVRPDGGMQCAVEIGYTRPEKLTAYRRTLKIPDVRWYDKQGRLHGDVEERVVRVRAELTVAVPESVRTYCVRDQAACYDAECIADVCAACPDCADTFCDCETDDCNCLTLLAEQCECDTCFDARYHYVLTHVITDGIKAFFPSLCDKCGATWLPDSADAGSLGIDLVDMTPREFASQYGAAQRMPWADAVALVREQYDLDLDYETDGEFLRDDDRQRLETAVRLTKEATA